ncbi:MAG: M1 family metallopeptidase [Thermaurantimonas sp.]|uniref:M1 family metallopeptidase n=1 Tax=Thermaurantimonas sp. TaxID=2681568 RepID=UPI00391938D2
MNQITDPHSFADLSGTRLTHLDWDAEIDFIHRKIKAVATWTLEYKKDTLVLDENGLRILSIKDQNGHLLPFEEHEVDTVRGGWIKIVLNPKVQKIAIEYETLEHPAALQWLEVNQTLGKRYPILFTQSQAILARSWLPCMDSPSIRFTYSARVKVPKGMLALMSAENPQEKSPDGIYTFSMKQPIPSYLMALAVGDFEFKVVSDRSGIYAEPELIDAAHQEFSDVEKMILAAESLYGPYLWDRYDLLVMPPSFPFGGMENPRLTFVTPTVIAGDKSLVSLVAHELAHSWSGNLVTNATWNDFWLNEGFTVYFELRIMEQIYGVEYAEMLAQLSYNELIGALNTLPPDETILKAKLDGKNPDDAVGPIAYEKGYFFLRTIEKKVGRRFFDEFLKKYFETYKFKSVTTEDFLEFLKANLLKKKDWEEINVEAWIYEPGLPPNIAKPNSTKFSAIESAAVSFLKTKIVPVTNRWTALEFIYFLQNLKGKIDEELCKKLDNQFHFTQSKNSEILAFWFLLCIETNYKPALGAMKQFTIQTGRRKFVIPIYKELIKKNQIQLAKSIFKDAAKNYHPITYNSVAQLFDKTL